MSRWIIEDKDGNWIGFECGYWQNLSGEKLGVEVDFVEIDWDNKVMELKIPRYIECGSGMGIDSETSEVNYLQWNVQNFYCNNPQVVARTRGK